MKFEPLQIDHLPQGFTPLHGVVLLPGKCMDTVTSDHSCLSNLLLNTQCFIINNNEASMIQIHVVFNVVVINSKNV